MNVVVIPEDKMIEVDGESLNFDFTIDNSIWAIHWDGSKGTVEYKDVDTLNEEITSFEKYQPLVDAFNAEKKRIADYEATRVIPLEELRTMRDTMLSDTDWTQLPDAQIPDAVKQQWTVYRQALRDLPNGYTPVAQPTFPSMPGSL